VIKEHAVATVNDLRAGTIDRNNLIERLADDSRLGLSRDFLDAILAKGDRESGAAKAQIAAFAAAVRSLEAASPLAAAYGPGSIL
jgi:adenylosuccinate lyase